MQKYVEATKRQKCSIEELECKITTRTMRASGGAKTVIREQR